MKKVLFLLIMLSFLVSCGRKGPPVLKDYDIEKSDQSAVEEPNEGKDQ